MPAEQVAALRTLASTVAAQDAAAALTEYERAAITLARATLTLLEENDKLRKSEKRKE